MGYRADFIRKFGDLFVSDDARKHSEGHDVESMEFDEQTEIVTIHFIGGATKCINVSGDSLSAMAFDVIQNGLW